MRTHGNPPISHGRILPTLEEFQRASQQVDDANQNTLPLQIADAPESTPFAYLLPQLQRPEALLVEGQDTRNALVELGMSMREAGSVADSSIPSIYTYFGQFVDHDITYERKSDTLASLSDPNLKPLPEYDITTKVVNQRIPALDLDNVYDAP